MFNTCIRHVSDMCLTQHALMFEVSLLCSCGTISLATSIGVLVNLYLDHVVYVNHCHHVQTVAYFIFVLSPTFMSMLLNNFIATICFYVRICIINIFICSCNILWLPFADAPKYAPVCFYQYKHYFWPSWRKSYCCYLMKFCCNIHIEFDTC